MPLRSVSIVQMDAEKAFVDSAAEEGRIVVHPTTCYGVRECGGSETFDQSCHWGTDGRYVCLRCAPLSCQLLVVLHHHVIAFKIRCKVAWACAVVLCVQMQEAALKPDRRGGTQWHMHAAYQRKGQAGDRAMEISRGAAKCLLCLFQ